MCGCSGFCGNQGSHAPLLETLNGKGYHTNIRVASFKVLDGHVCVSPCVRDRCVTEGEGHVFGPEFSWKRLTNLSDL